MNGKPWLPEHTDMLGKIPDAELAEKTGHALVTVRIRRRLRGLQPKRAPIVPLSLVLKSKYHSR